MAEEDMSKEERENLFEELGIEPKRSSEQETKNLDVPVIEENDEENEERKEKELEQYREVSGF